MSRTIERVWELCGTSLPRIIRRESAFIEHDQTSAILQSSNRKAEVNACPL